MTAAAIDTVIVFTEDHRALAAFYEQALELDPPEAFGDTHLGFTVGDLYLGFDSAEAAGGSDSVTLWFRVDDIDATFARCIELGAVSRYPPEAKPFGDTVAAVIDPAGNHFGLSQRKD